MASPSLLTVVLGDEFDDSLRTALREVLVSLGVTGVASDWGVAGSQEVERVEVVIGGRSLVIGAETYVGLAISGEAELTAQVEALVKSKLRGGDPGGDPQPG